MAGSCEMSGSFILFPVRLVSGVGDTSSDFHKGPRSLETTKPRLSIRSPLDSPSQSPGWQGNATSLFLLSWARSEQHSDSPP